MIELFMGLECLNNDTVHPVMVCFSGWDLGADHDHVHEIRERCFSVCVEDSLHLPPSVAGCDASQSRLVLDQTIFLDFRHGQ